MGDFQKRIMSDIVPPKKINPSSPLPSPVQPLPPPRKNIDLHPPKEIVSIPKKQRKFQFFNFKFPKFKVVLWSCLILFFYVVLSVVFAEMKVEVVPKTFSISLNEIIELSQKPSPGKLAFNEIYFADKRNGSFVSSQKKSLESKARGMITVTNKNSISQVLVAGTRFESSSGKIYKIEKGIVVPINGTLDTEIVAQNAGVEFNEENYVDFTIPGFKEQRSPKFNTVYAKSKTKIEGGFSGVTLVVCAEDLKNAKNTLLKDALFETSQTLTRKTPEDSFFLAQSARYNVVSENSEPKAGQAGDKFNLQINGSATGVIINKKSLEKFLGKQIPNYDVSSFHFRIDNLDNLSFELVDFKPGKSDFTLKVSGIAQFVGDMDKDQIQRIVFEKQLKKSLMVLEQFPEVSRVKIHFRPFWLRSFPESKERVEVEVRG